MKSQGIKIQENIPLAPFTTFKIGGPARFFCEVSSEEEISEALRCAKDNNLKIFVLGGGSNILISDDGFDGLVIRILNTSCIIHDTSIECGAGLSFSKAVGLAKENSLSGLAWAAGIPGSVGGAIRGNAGAYGGEIKDCIESVKVVEIMQNANLKNKNDNAKLKIFTNSECGFNYRSSIFKQNQNLI
ncbi:MAG: FAD-binding protein, partial [Candidatus Pacebacteria bacterium]|nr:FAD-binding protein [Candidatus Paceibacterota bacterium]